MTLLSENQTSNKEQLEIVSLDQLVPENHLLRKINRLVDFSFVYDVCRDLYSESTGRPSIDPVILVKLALIQKLFGIRSMRKTIQEVEVNVAYRWFLGYNLTEPILHFGTFSKNYTRRFRDTDIFRQLFERTLELCLTHGKIDPSILFVDATHVKACANKKKNVKVEIEQSAKWYSKDLEKEIGLEREANNKKPLKPQAEKKITVTQSITDPDSGLFHKGEHKQVFAYNVQTACDKNAYVLDYTVHGGNEHDSKTFPMLYEKLRKFNPEMIVADAGYKTPAIVRMLMLDGVQPLLPYTRPKGAPQMFQKKDFVYDEYHDSYICPNNQLLKYSTTNRDGYREYRSNPRICKDCPMLGRCTKSRNHVKLVTKHVWEPYMDRAEDIRYTIGNREIYAKRKETIERVFGLTKEVMGMRYTMNRGKRWMEDNVALAYSAYNLKKLIRYLERRGKDLLSSVHFWVFQAA